MESTTFHELSMVLNYIQITQNTHEKLVINMHKANHICLYISNNTLILKIWEKREINLKQQAPSWTKHSSLFTINPSCFLQKKSLLSYPEVILMQQGLTLGLPWPFISPLFITQINIYRWERSVKLLTRRGHLWWSVLLPR